MCKTNNVECQTALQKLKLQSVQFQAGAHPAPVPGTAIPRSSSFRSCSKAAEVLRRLCPICNAGVVEGQRRGWKALLSGEHHSIKAWL